MSTILRSNESIRIYLSSEKLLESVDTSKCDVDRDRVIAFYSDYSIYNERHIRVAVLL
ncbi:MAG: hypothetical protein NVS4B11_21670 [Ktedonobacteraceae bacterium]